MADVFISYSHKDTGWVKNTLLPRLEAAGLSVIIDYRDFAIGVPSVINMERAVANARYTLLVLTPAWVSSDWTEFESLLIGTVDPSARQGRIIPLLLHPTDLPSRIAMLTYVDFTDPAQLDPQMGRLIHHLQPQPDQRPDRPYAFISYKRDVEPDASLAMDLYTALAADTDIFIDRTMSVGTHWVDRIREELERSDYLILLLSEQAVHSEMVLEEIKTAHSLARTRNDGRPRILPVRVNYRAPFQYPLDIYLNKINWAVWEGDTPALVDDLRRAMTGGALSIDDSAKPAVIQARDHETMEMPTASAQPLEMPEGTMDLRSRYYIERSRDREALNEIQHQGVTITIKGPRQMGKSSLLMRIVDAAIQQDKNVAFLDFQLFNRDAMQDADSFFRQFAIWLTDELELPVRIDDYWDPDLGNNMRCTRYMSRYLLKEIDGPLLLAMDEVESVFDTPFRSDFFSMLRAWHNQRATRRTWRQLDLALVTSTEPYQFIDNLNLSPFNVGLNLDLEDFTLDEVSELNERHRQPLDESGVRRMMALLNGHPYLVRRALYMVASGRMTVDDLFRRAAETNGPFGDHLRHHLFRLKSRPFLIDGLRQILDTQTADDDAIIFRLQSAGLVLRKQSRTVVPRCQLYADFFREHLYA